MLPNKSKPCPICKHKSHLKFSLPGFGDYQGSGTKFTLYTCSDCGHQFFLPRPRKLKNIYEKKAYVYDGQKHPFVYDGQKHPLSQKHGDIKTWPQYKTFDSRLDKIYPFMKTKDFQLLDVGCGSGLFVRICEQKGIKAVGIDISKTAIKLSKEITSHCYQKDFSKESRHNKFHIVTMFDLLEHLLNPLIFLEKAHKILKKNGMLVLTTPRADSLTCKIFRKHWHLYIPPLHLNIFSKDSLNLVLKKTGFKILKIEHQGQWTNLSYFLLKTLSLYGLKRREIEDFIYKTGLTGFNLYFNLFDVMTAYARKQNLI